MRVAAFALVLALSPTAHAQDTDLMDRIEQALSYESADGNIRLQGSGLLDLELYTIDDEPPGLIFEDSDDVFVQPRLSLFLDTFIGERFYAFAQARADRGFDPGLQDPDARLDELFARWSLLDKGRLDLQAGKFATVVGNFVPRHHSWDNAFVTAPLPYENVTTASDNAAPESREAFLDRRDDEDKKGIWVPLVWGPSYAMGASVAGAWSKLTYAFEVKNAALSSRPTVWADFDEQWKDPTVSGRIGFMPSPAWTLGLSASRGAYMRPDAEDTFAPGKDIGDFPQTLIGGDLKTAGRRWTIWAEAMLGRFDVPTISNLDTFAYYVEAKIEPRGEWFVGLRWNQQVFEEISDGAGSHVPWDRDVWRIDASVGARPLRYLQAKLQYGFTEHDGPTEQVHQLVALQLTAKF